MLYDTQQCLPRYVRTLLTTFQFMKMSTIEHFFLFPAPYSRNNLGVSFLAEIASVRLPTPRTSIALPSRLSVWTLLADLSLTSPCHSEEPRDASLSGPNLLLCV